MSKRKICRICLRTDLQIHDIEETLVDFHDEISEYAIYENSALKYCSVCEYLLRKFYNFSRKCRKANKILKEFKKNKTRGFPSNLYEMLPPTPFGFSTASTLQQFNLINGILEPLAVQLLIKQEKDSDELEDHLAINDNLVKDTLETNDVIQEDSHMDVPGNYVVRIINESDVLQDDDKNEKKGLADIDFKDDDIESDIEIKSEDECIDIKENNFSEDSSDTELIKEYEKRIKAKNSESLTKSKSPTKTKARVRVRKRKGVPAQPRPKQEMRNRKEYETVFDIQVFMTVQEAKEEMEKRKTSDAYLTAEHKCEICYTVYKHAKLLEFHMRWHGPSAGDQECGVCHMRFKSKKALSQHRNGSHYGKFKCKKCPMTTYHKIAMETHYQKHLGIKFVCKICNHSFNHCSTYKTHLRLRHKTEHVCVTCARTFVSEKGLYAHRNIVHKTKSKVDSDATAHCAPCKLTFANEQVYTVHLKNTEIHKDLASTIIACKVCGIRFEDNEDLKVHRRSLHPKYQSIRKGASSDRVDSSGVVAKTRAASGKDSYKCTVCGLLGSTRLWIVRHASQAHPDTPYVLDLKRRRQHMCETCGKCYTSMYFLRDHLNTHTGTKPYQCSVCPARFTSRVNLRTHEDWHAPPKRECSYCGKKFISASNLYNHMRSHIQDRRYKCSLCHKDFLHASTLREHVRGVHHNVRRTRKRVKREASPNES